MRLKEEKTLRFPFLLKLMIAITVNDRHRPQPVWIHS